MSLRILYIMCVYTAWLQTIGKKRLCKYLPIPTRGAVNGRSFLGLAEEWILWMATPQLLTWIKCAILQGTEKDRVLHLKVLPVDAHTG